MTPTPVPFARPALLLSLLALAGGLSLAAETPLFSAAFEPVPAGSTPAAPAGWSWYGDWGQVKKAPQTGGLDALNPGDPQSLVFLAPPEGTLAGWVSPFCQLPPLAAAFRLTFKARSAPQTSGWRLYAFVTWHDADGRFLDTAKMDTYSPAEDKFKTYTQLVLTDKRPAQASQARLNFAASRVKDATAPLGRIGVTEIGLAALDSLPLSLTAEKFASWWQLGETVRYRATSPNTVAPDLAAVTGVVSDSAGREVGQIRADRETFLRDGWTWTAPEPGFYEIAFAWQNRAGESTPVTRSYWMQPREGKYKSMGDPVEIHHDQFPLVVAARAPRPAGQKQRQFGGCEHYDGSFKQRVQLAELLDLSFIRLCWIDWQRLEPERGKLDWSSLDQVVADLKARDFDLIGTFYGTPRWASSHPDETERYVTPRYSAYAPRDLADWTRFVSATAERYGDFIREWEIWNEPFSPRGSVYWWDNSENYAKMLISAYDAIKAKQPQAVVGLAGAAALSTFREALNCGAGGHYDSLSPHGSWPDPTDLRAVEKSIGLPVTERWTNFEWHAILRRYNGHPVDHGEGSEPALCRRLLLDLANQIHLGVDRVAFFEMINLDEMEELPYDRTLNHSSGLFRRKPALEPRLPALVFNTLVARVQDRLEHAGWYAFGDQKIAAFRTGGQRLLMFWTEGKEASAPGAELAAALAEAAEIVDWEGRPQKNDFQLQPGLMYFADGGKLETLAAWTPRDDVIISPKKVRATALANTVIPLGRYVQTPLFDHPGGKLNEAAIVWNEQDWRWLWKPEIRPANYSARFAAGVSDQGLDLIVEVVDAKHEQTERPGEYYNGDSVQFGFDTENSGLQPQSEFQLALTAAGPAIWKTMAGYTGGDLPGNYSGDSGPIRYAAAHIERRDGRTIYQLRMNLGELYPFTYKPDQDLRLSVLVNNNDGQGRAGFLEWSSGIGPSKDVTRYGRLTCQAGGK